MVGELGDSPSLACEGQVEEEQGKARGRESQNQEEYNQGEESRGVPQRSDVV